MTDTVEVAPMHQRPELSLETRLEQIQETMDDAIEQLTLVSRQNDLVIQYCRVLAEAFALREKLRPLDVEYEKNKQALRDLRKRRNGP
jgi:hypothetical protein